MSNKQILENEMELLKKDIIQVYEKSGKMVTGNFAKELENRTTDKGTYTKVELYGVPYLAGRKKGDMPPVENLRKWVIDKGIFKSLNDKQATSIAWAIAKSIKERGTNPKYHLSIYDEVITAQRIDSIIQKVTSFNVSLFVGEIVIEMQKFSNAI